MSESPALATRTPLSRTSFSKSSIVSLPEIVLHDSFEKELAKFYESTQDYTKLLIDFYKAEYVEIATLSTCIATLVDRNEKGLLTFIAYPAHKRVRDFFKMWRFPEAVQAALQTEFRQILVTKEHHYLDEEQTTYSGRGEGLNKLENNLDFREGLGSRRNFFELVTIRHEGEETGAISPEGKFGSVPGTLGRTWTEPLISEVLERKVAGGSPKADIARVIVYEALSNAVRHPQARIIQVASIFHRAAQNEDRDSGSISDATSKKVKRNPSLRICIWDDGEPIAETLSKALKETGTIRAVNFPPFMMPNILVTIRNPDESINKQIVVDPSKDITPEDATEPRLLLASVFPGISRVVQGPVPQVDAFGHEDSMGTVAKMLYTAPGIGLYALMKTVLDQFQGTLFMRSGKFRLVLEVASTRMRKDYGVQYASRITPYPEHLPPFRGNMISALLPLRDI